LQDILLFFQFSLVPPSKYQDSILTYNTYSTYMIILLCHFALRKFWSWNSIVK